MAAPTPQLASWLRCPRCGREIAAAADGLVCDTGHRWEINKRGYAALVEGRSGMHSETAAQLDAEDAAFAAGERDELLEAVDAVTPRGGGGALLDVGGGTGHLVAHLLATRGGWSALSASNSPAGLARTLSRTGADGLLCDLTRSWPIRGGVASALLAVGAAAYPVEFHRVLQPGGILITGSDTGSQLIDDLYPWFEHDQSRSLSGDQPVAAVLRLRRRRRALQY